jgi:hypothetical protein
MGSVNAELDYKVADCTLLAPPAFFSKQMNVPKRVIKNLFKLWRQAIHNFLNEYLIHHDALVGENACHIRAAVLIDLSLDFEIKQYLIKIANNLHHLIESLDIITITENDRKGSIKEFLLKHRLTFNIHESRINTIKFILDSYLLTLTKETLPSTGFTLCERTTHEPLLSMGFVHNKAKILVKNTQKSLSDASCAYIKSEARQLNIQSLNLLLRIKKDAHHRSYLSQFVTGKVLLLRMLKKNRYFLIKINRFLKNKPVDQINLCLKPNHNQIDFQITSERMALNTPCMVAVGSVNYDYNLETKKQYISRLLSQSFLDIFLATFAVHPQYSGELKHLPPPFQEVLDELENQLVVLSAGSGHRYKDIQQAIAGIIVEKTDYEEKKKYALEIGCALENPSLLFFNHIYGDMLSNHKNITWNLDDQIERSICH